LIRLPRTIRLDPSDRVVFAAAAEPGEWAVPGTFLFAGRPVAQMGRKDQIAFRSGFLGIASWGFSTLVTVSEARPEDRTAAVSALAEALVVRLGAPDLVTATPAAEEEIALAEDLCRGYAPGTLIALHRAEEDGAIRERFRTLKPRDATAFGAGYLRGHDRAFHIVEEAGEEAGEGIDLAALGRKDGA